MNRKAIMFVLGLGLAAFMIGVGVTSRIYSRVIYGPMIAEAQVSTCFEYINNTRITLECVRDNEPEKAIVWLNSRLNRGFESLEFLAEEFDDPDLLTNSIIIEARKLQKEMNIEPSIQSFDK